MAKPYPPQLREAAVKDIISKTLKYKEACEKYGISEGTLRDWVYKTKLHERVSQHVPDLPKVQAVVKPPLPRGVTLKQAHTAVVLRDHLGADSEAFGAYCRAQGFQVNTVAKWAAWFETHEMTDMDSYRAVEISGKNKDDQIKALSKELDRQTKALAETAALLVLSKKAEAIWGTREG